MQREEILRLQENLGTIRKIAGWTTQDLGDRIGVTKQTISNLENKKTGMTLTQYIAIRTVLDYEIANNRDNEVLPQAAHLLLDVPTEELSDEDRKKIQYATTTLAAASAGGVGIASLIAVSAGLLGGIVGIAMAGVSVGTASWLQRLMNNKE